MVRFVFVATVSLAALIGLCVSGCCPDGPLPTDGQPDLEVEPLTLDFAAAGGWLTFEVRSVGTADLEFTVSEEADWLTVAPVEADAAGLAPGGSVSYRVTVQPLLTLASSRQSGDPARTAPVTITSNGGNAVVTVNQAAPAGEPILDVEPTSLSFEYPGGQRTFTITNNGTEVLNWSILHQDSWFSVDGSEGTLDPSESIVITVSCDFNTTMGMRQSSLTVDSNAGYEAVGISQLGSYPGV